MPTEAHRELCARMMLPDSDRLARIWEAIADEADARLLLAMPATFEELAAASGFDPDELRARLDELFHRGVVFRAVKPEGPVYRAPRHLIQFHDASNQWPEAPSDFLALWKEFMNQEYPGVLAMLLAGGFGAFMRAVPGLGATGGLAGLEPIDDLAAMIATADCLAVCNCPCSRVEQECAAPLQRCLQVGKGARYVLERGTGRELSAVQALELLRGMEEHGLVHLVENKQGLGTVICNCCTCCCAMLKPGLRDPACRAVVAPSRFSAVVLPDACSADGLCAEACPVGSIGLDDSAGCAVVDAERCLGCGLCLAACVSDALRLSPVRPTGFIPG